MKPLPPPGAPAEQVTRWLNEVLQVVDTDRHGLAVIEPPCNGDDLGDVVASLAAADMEPILTCGGYLARCQRCGIPGAVFVVAQPARRVQ